MNRYLILFLSDNGESWRIAGTLPAEAGLDPNESQVSENKHCKRIL